MRYLSQILILGLFSCLIIILSSCASSKQVYKHQSFKYTYDIPPGTVQIDSNLFADQTEISNLSYREYVYWTKRVFGESSEKFQSAMIDTNLWAYKDSAVMLPIKTYFNHHWFNNYPVVGIDYQQAIDYANWRSDRVFEYLLIKNKLIDILPDQDSTNYFSIEGFLAGKSGQELAKAGFPIPRYRLPKISEWEYLAHCSSDSLWGIDSSRAEIKKAIKNKSPLYLTTESASYWQQQDLQEITHTCESMSFPGNSKGLYDLIGNVAEMTATKGVAKGGSWAHSKEASVIQKHQSYRVADNWLGFRCVCSWESPL
jgi:formylglycine-generating enzyme required for sulfatase activity